MTTNAAERVFGTGELLELILLRSSIADCGRTSQITTFCRDAIAGSRKLQRFMFFESTPAEYLTRECRSITEEAHEKSVEKIKRENAEGRLRSQTFNDVMIGRLHPALGRTEAYGTGAPGRVAVLDLEQIAAWSKGRGRDMAISEPKCQRIELADKHMSKRQIIQVRTLGELLEAAEEYEAWRFADGRWGFVKESPARIFFSGYVEEWETMVVRARQRACESGGCGRGEGEGQGG